MLWFNKVLHAYMLRLPFFFAIYAATLPFFGDTGISVFMLILMIFTLLCILDMQIQMRNAFVVLCVVAGVALILLEQYMFALFVMSAIFRPTRYIGLYNTIFVCVVLITLQFADIMHSNTLILCLLIQVMCIFFAKQMNSLEFFLGSHYCRQISRKTAMSVIKRSYKFSAICLLGIFIVGFILISSFNIEPIEIPTEVEHVEEAIAILEEMHSPAQESQMEEFFVEEELALEETGNDIGLEPLHLANLEMVAMVVVIALLVAILIFLIIFSDKRRRVNTFEDFDEDEFEDSALQDKQSGKRKRFLLFGPNFTVRRLFKKKVRRYGKVGILPRKFDTPKHLAHQIDEHENIDNLLNLYHKARYSGQQVTRSEVNSLK